MPARSKKWVWVGLAVGFGVKGSWSTGSIGSTGSVGSIGSIRFRV